MQQAEDFRAEYQALAAILRPLDEDDFSRVTQFKGWTISDVLGHLHLFNTASDLSLKDGALFDKFIADILQGLAEGRSLLEIQGPFLDGLAGRALFDVWQAGSEKVADNFLEADPKKRLKWAGPDMSARSAITARQMETWAHGQEVFDLLGVQRVECDRLRNIVHLGINTFGWTFQNRGLVVPDLLPDIRLTAPSGAVWDWIEGHSDSCIAGSAVEFAQVVAQTRSINDTSLEVTGRTARQWMNIAQCFAGPAVEPPEVGTRFLTC